MSKDFDSKIARLERQIAQLREEKAQAERMSPERKLATALHDLMCHYNHTDGCDWYYSKNFDSHAHGVYLEKARKMIRWCDEVGISPVLAQTVLEVANEKG